jgi:hypothetical protein
MPDEVITVEWISTAQQMLNTIQKVDAKLERQEKVMQKLTDTAKKGAEAAAGVTQGVRQMTNADGIWRVIAGQCSPLVVARMPDCVSPADFVSRLKRSISTLESPEPGQISEPLRPIRRAIYATTDLDRCKQGGRIGTAWTSCNVGRRSTDAAGSPQGVWSMTAKKGVWLAIRRPESGPQAPPNGSFFATSFCPYYWEQLKK